MANELASSKTSALVFILLGTKNTQLDHLSVIL